MARRATRFKYKPGDIVKYGDDDEWQCFCDTGPENDWRSAGKEVASCFVHDNRYGHVNCYGCSEIHKDKTTWTDYTFSCIECNGADPNVKPKTIQLVSKKIVQIQRGQVEQDEQQDEKQDEKQEEKEETLPEEVIEILAVSTLPEDARDCSDQTNDLMSTPPPNTTNIPARFIDKMFDTS